MLLLAIDTSGKDGSIALANCHADDCQIIGLAPLDGGAFSAQLVPQISALLKTHGFTKKDIDAFAATSGPGSFTGLRVGLAAVKGLAEVLNKPIAVVSLLEAIAASGQDPVLAAMDAGRKEIYARQHDGSESLFTQEEFLAAAGGQLILTPDKSVLDFAGAAGLQVEEVPRPRSDAIARLGWKKIQSGQTISPEALDANYLRRSDQIFAKIS
ncbi:MAG: tRNA (adenosine(37)-N6)-threonylcarbamoyltransferase complex dimerization subunit type 1 TsaB [Terriglobales bacterium]|jgi:tRNA threonylcarbamoyladenosine biosynthesis protein TsaB